MTEKRICEYEKIFRSDEEKYNGEQLIKEFPRSVATFHCSFKNLKERPINLKIKLQALIDNKLAVELHPCTINNNMTI